MSQELQKPCDEKCDECKIENRDTCQKLLPFRKKINEILVSSHLDLAEGVTILSMLIDSGGRNLIRECSNIEELDHKYYLFFEQVTKNFSVMIQHLWCDYDVARTNIQLRIIGGCPIEDSDKRVAS